ncbi:23S rRNA (pseudouridine(1915)-N(3))-methyltransferase RlmH [Duncaniella dubosii]|jgi:23S rRNA (pseudouridine1915-N3)-methyltransferase|uniref:23S rRNA (pseudouridine(1915)-N(3))-methyltransferase RlmH n=1 Tax=Duncaniella dubosii TaxID=2518971 RepID=UPI000A84F4CD|nr:23S rRNA (pseudouridine(1915)-N(3))-methyltransferase RlmH [Duncaniella dubosii]MCX4283713.1 23S rRNA (pseudouridine(1915)-N(3))-methyltransferase RlmH [Duncaniella dubosii]
MKFCLLVVGKTASSFMSKGIEEYKSRVNRYVGFEIISISDLKSTRGLTEMQQKEKEGEMLLASLTPSDTVILLDEKGREYTSREFADFQTSMMNRGVKRLVYVIGGPYGFSQKVYDRADGKISLSRMTFSHEMARLFFCEQLYRAMTILRGEPYHHD